MKQASNTKLDDAYSVKNEVCIAHQILSTYGDVLCTPNVVCNVFGVLSIPSLCHEYNYITQSILGLFLYTYATLLDCT